MDYAEEDTDNEDCITAMLILNQGVISSVREVYEYEEVYVRIRGIRWVLQCHFKKRSYTR